MYWFLNEMCVRHGDYRFKKDLDKAQAALDKAIAKWQGNREKYNYYYDQSNPGNKIKENETAE